MAYRMGKIDRNITHPETNIYQQIENQNKFLFLMDFWVAMFNQSALYGVIYIYCDICFSPSSVAIFICVCWFFSRSAMGVITPPTRPSAPSTVTRASLETGISALTTGGKIRSLWISSLVWPSVCEGFGVFALLFSTALGLLRGTRWERVNS